MESEQQNPEIIRLTGICEELSARVLALENQNAQIIERLAKLEVGDENDAGLPEETEPPVIALGNAGKLSRVELEHRRDCLLGFLEPRWSEVEAIIANAKSALALQAALFDKYSGLIRSESGVKSLIENQDALWSFVRMSGRYGGQAIDIASAMAGVPELEPRTSHDYLLAKKHRGKSDAIPFGAMNERTKRISASKRRKPGSTPLREMLQPPGQTRSPAQTSPNATQRSID